VAVDGDDGSGVRRSVDLIFDSIQSRTFYLGDQTQHGVCHGDSGGPSFHTFPDGVERLVGVHSFTARTDCLLGGDTRVDAFAPFIQGWLTDKDATGSNTSLSLLQDGTMESSPSCGSLGWPALWPLGGTWALTRRRRRTRLAT
jgi:uncharacterized protein (TIGR03382 family)